MGTINILIEWALTKYVQIIGVRVVIFLKGFAVVSKKGVMRQEVYFLLINAYLCFGNSPKSAYFFMPYYQQKK